MAALATILLTASAPVWAQSDAGIVARSESVSGAERFVPRWEIGLNGQIGAPFGFVKVGEVDRAGTKLGLRGDLGIDAYETTGLAAAWHLTDRDAIRGRFDYTFLYGDAELDRNIAFNGALIAGGTELSTKPIFARGTLLFEHAFVQHPDGTLLAAGGGLTFTYLHWKMTGTLAAATIGHETGEDFYAQELPIPLVSVRGEYPLMPRLKLLGTIDGGALPSVDSLRTEGGTVKLAQAHADVFAGLRYEITPRLFADGGYSYTYFSQHEKSHEDDNKILFIGHGFAFGMTYLF
jgi:opacity protein-like surface antigen